MLHLLAGLAPRAAVETNSVANYFLADQLIKELGDMRREISEKIREKVGINPPKKNLPTICNSNKDNSVCVCQFCLLSRLTEMFR